MQSSSRAEKPRPNPSIAFLVHDARSGSTLLSDILTRRLGGLYVTPEIAFTRLLKLSGRRGRALPRAGLARRMVTDNLLRNLGVGAAELERIVAGLPDPAPASEVIRRVVAAHLAAVDAGRPGCVIVKHGVHVRVWREIAAAFGGDAKFIHIVRDPRAVVSSKLRTTRPYATHEPQAWYGPLVGAWRWRSYSAEMRAAQAAGVAVLDVAYEALLEDPASESRRIAQFLGATMRTAGEIPAPDYRIPDAERMIHALVEGGRVVQARAEAWASELTPRDLRTIEAVAAAEMSARGYPPTRASAGAARAAVIFRELPRLAKALVAHAWRQLQHRSAGRSSACRPG
jgi:sulfotransferase family protein